MRTLDQWLTEYAVSHRHPTNKKIHNICVPLIMLSLLGILWVIPTPAFMDFSAFANWAIVFSLACLIFYFSLGVKTGAVMVAVLVPMALILYGIEAAGLPLLWISIGIFVISWVGQFIGHKIEGKKPSFFQDLQFLLIGPLWVFLKP